MAHKRVKSSEKEHVLRLENSNRSILIDISLIFIVTLFVATLLQNFRLSIDWDTLNSVLTMNSPGYTFSNGFSDKYHILTQPIAYVLTTIMSPVLGWDALYGYIALISISAAATLSMIYYLVFRLTKERFPAAIAVLFMALTYDFVFLTYTVEDNVPNIFLLTLFFFFMLALIERIETKINPYVLSAITGVVIAIAVGTHYRSLFLMPFLGLVVIFDKDHKRGLKKAVIAIVVALICLAGLIIVNQLTSYHASTAQNTVEFFNVTYQSDPQLWFFANGGGDVSKQINDIERGLSQSLTGVYLPYSIGVFIALAMILIVAWAAYRARYDSAIITFACLLLMYSFCALFFDSFSLERWDTLVLPLSLMVGVVMSKKYYKKEHLKIYLVIGALAIFLILQATVIMNNSMVTQFSYVKVVQNEYSKDPGHIYLSLYNDTEATLYARYLYGSNNVSVTDGDWMKRITKRWRTNLSSGRYTWMVRN